jgi:hypothetical protein
VNPPGGIGPPGGAPIAGGTETGVPAGVPGAAGVDGTPPTPPTGVGGTDGVAVDGTAGASPYCVILWLVNNKSLTNGCSFLLERKTLSTESSSLPLCEKIVPTLNCHEVYIPLYAWFNMMSPKAVSVELTAMSIKQKWVSGEKYVTSLYVLES